MKDIRIGNDINVKWSIFGDGAPYILEGKDVSLYLCTPFGKRKAEGFSIVGNQITWTFAGKDQSRTGKYSLELVVNADKEGQVTTDACNFVNLVNCSCKVGGADESNVEIESIELTSELGFLPYDDAELREAVATLERKKVDKEEGKGLSTNDYTDEEKKKNVVASFLNGASLQGLPFGYVGGTYQSYQLDGEVNEEIDLGQIAESYYGNIAFSYEDKLYEFKIADLKSEGATLGTILVRVNDDNHLIVKPFAPRVALLGWRTYGDRTKMPSAWVEGGDSYDDTEIRDELTKLSEEIALRNVCAEDTDESVDEPDLPTPTPSNEWKCVYDGRLEVGAQILEFTTYADGTPLKASELIVQVYLDAVATTAMQGYVQINSTNNKTLSYYGAVYTELDDAEKIPCVGQIKLQASPMYMIADIVDRAVPKIAQGSVMSNHRLGSVTPPQIYEDIVYVRFLNNIKVKDTPPLIKIYAR